ncbi:hypothetical protein KQI84_11665 [bacterium]|nr:hypothetical protein [bacterium]
MTGEPQHEPSKLASDLRLIAVFLMGLSMGICLMLIYTTWRERNSPHPASPPPAAELEHTK